MRDLSRRARGAGDAPSWGRRARKRRGERAPRPSASPRARPWSGKAHQVGRRRPWRAPRPSRACRQCRRGPWKSPRAARRAPGGRARGNRRASTWRERGRVRESGECGPVRERLAVGRRRGAAATDAGREARARKSRLTTFAFLPLRLSFRETLRPRLRRSFVCDSRNRLDRERSSANLFANSAKNANAALTWR